MMWSVADFSMNSINLDLGYVNEKERKILPQKAKTATK